MPFTAWFSSSSFEKVEKMQPDMFEMMPEVIDGIHGTIRQLKELSRQHEMQLTPLMTAANTGQEDIVRKSLERGDDINAETNKGETAITEAVSGHHPEIVRILVEHGASICAGSHGLSALHLAALLNDVECAAMLLDCGADVDVQETEFGNTPLHEATAEGDGDFIGPDVARLLIERGADLTIKDKDGKTVSVYTREYYDNWSRFTESVWLGENQLALIELVQQATADQMKARQDAA